MRSALLAIIVVIVALAIAGCGSKCGDLPGTVATVNGEEITCGDFASQMNVRVGREVLQNMIEQDIIMQWAEKAGVPPTEAQVDKQLQLQKDEGQYEEQVKVFGEDMIKRETSNLQARMNLAKKYIKISDAEIEQAYDSMKMRYVRGPRRNVAVILNPDKAKLEKAEKELKDAKDFDEVAKKYGVGSKSPIKTWVFEGQQGMPPEVVAASKDTKQGKTSGIVALSTPTGEKTFFILKVLDSQPAINKKLADVRDEVADMVALQKSQFDPDFTKKLNAKMKAAKVEIKMPQYEDLTEHFKNPPDQSGMMMPR
jgi:foldase protein PrsA